MANIETLGRQIDEISEQLQPEERARFRRQREAEYLKLLIAGRQHLELQALPIGNPDPIPKKIFRKKKTHGKTDARALTGTEIAEKEHAAREAALIANAARKEAGVTPPSTPPQAGESQYQTTIMIPLKPSLRRASQAPIWHVAPFPTDNIPEGEARELPPSTAPPRLEQEQRQAQRQAKSQEQGRDKRRKVTKKLFDNSTPR